MSVVQDKDVYAGALLALVGSAFAWGATSYTVGTSARMGPGYFPMVLGVLLALLGVLILLRGWRKALDQRLAVGPWAWKPLFFIVAANLLFGVLLGGLPSLNWPAMGFIVAIFGLTLVAGLAGERFNLKESLLLALVLAVGSYLAFVLLLQLQLPVWPVVSLGQGA
ncbi:tripartite tricarboxylate transporter TctB family protein [Rhodoferax sp. U11-2br]|uniref:tripartite tricarboxylate transporter TctB family protein n=1 Tax=Rhodoferax sp. U11-2br TaxID=2838878 RepID=UPI001BEAC946|nr:tripartite tricarboxylate transporter TctB family protein [Rhodoferax sp. U11-2br]MBT3068809.1 tripartite tricarboxylate transporter TctB family protein [Rhodoferax sp. U11-2br]